MVAAASANGRAEEPLFSPLQVGNITLQHRIVLAPLTRYRADLNHVHHDPATVYYSQRAQAPGTLLISEGTFISPEAGGFDNAPGIYTREQIAAWKNIVNGVHARGSCIFLQLWALGRAADEEVLNREGQKVVAPSEVGLTNGAKPSAMTNDEIEQFKESYAQAARNFVLEAGGDGVEIHGANGYLVDQFFSKTSNFRTDQYGGSLENRLRFGLEVVDAVTAAVGDKRTAIRISPYSPFQEMKMDSSDIKETYGGFVKALKERHPDLAYLHVVRSRIGGASDVIPEGDQEETLEFIQNVWQGPLFIAGGFQRDDALDMARTYPNTAIVFGRHFIPNPDLVKRLKHNLPLTPYNRATFYTKGPQAVEGYIDYPDYNKPSAKDTDMKDIHNLLRALETTVQA